MVDTQPQTPASTILARHRFSRSVDEGERKKGAKNAFFVYCEVNLAMELMELFFKLQVSLRTSSLRTSPTTASTQTSPGTTTTWWAAHTCNSPPQKITLIFFQGDASDKDEDFKYASPEKKFKISLNNSWCICWKLQDQADVRGQGEPQATPRPQAGGLPGRRQQDGQLKVRGENLKKIIIFLKK